MKKYVSSIVFQAILLFIGLEANGQMITGFWKGTINRQKVEVKLVQRGDSLYGSSYYYTNASNFRRYSIKGYFDASTNEAVWWDDKLLEEKPARKRGHVPLVARADFNCPGDGRMMLDGKAHNGEDDEEDLHLKKIENPLFYDEWDFVIDNFLVGTNDPEIIDSVALIAYNQPLEKDIPILMDNGDRAPKPVAPIEPPVARVEKPVTPPPTPKPTIKVPVVVKKEEPPLPAVPLTIEQKFTSRKKNLVQEIPLEGDSLELRFYDNAEIDGDSISLFMNDKLIFSHIRLTGNAYTIRFAISELADINELTMVAENLGSIPPNTSFMVAEMGEKKYEARLESTEGSSAVVRFVKGRN